MKQKKRRPPRRPLRGTCCRERAGRGPLAVRSASAGLASSSRRMDEVGRRPTWTELQRLFYFYFCNCCILFIMCFCLLLFYLFFPCCFLLLFLFFVCCPLMCVSFFFFFLFLCLLVPRKFEGSSPTLPQQVANKFQKSSKKIQQSSKSCATIVPKSSQNVPKLFLQKFPKWSKNVPKTFAKCSHQVRKLFK